MALSRSISSSSLPFGAAAFLILLWLAAIGGWIANIVKIFGSADDPITAFFVIRCVGVFAAPVGAILGFL